MPSVDRIVLDATNCASRTMNDGVTNVSNELHGQRSSSVRLGDEEAVPNPFTDLESNSVEKMVRNPARDNV